MEEIIYRLDIKGWVHLIASILALLTGTYTIMTKKATGIHKKIGYVYATSMFVVIITSFMIYRLFNGFGIFHGFAILSAIALVGGMLPMLKKERTLKDLRQHAEVMGWSVVGLYCAFISEIATRIEFKFATIFLFVGCGITCTIGSILIKHTRDKYLPLKIDRLNE